MLCIQRNQTVSFNGSNAVSSELMPNLNLSCDVDFTDINLTDFPIDVPLEDSLDQMFNQREFDQIGLESGYSTTGTTTPETITVTDSQPNLSLGFRFDQISDRPNQGSVIGSTETSMSSAPTTPSSATLPSFMEIYSPRVPLQAGSTTTATLTSSTSTSTINPQSTVSPVDHSNETFFKFDDIGLEEDTSLSEVSFGTINKKLTGQSTSISSVDLDNIGFNIKQESEASSPVSPSLSLISNSFESGQFSSHNLAEIPFTCVPSNRTATLSSTLSSTLSPPPISSAFKSVNTSQNYSPSSLATIGGASSSSSASTNQLESIRSYTSLSRSSVSSVTTPKSIYEGSSGRRSTSTTSSGESSPNDLSIQKQSIQYEGLSCHRRVQQHEIRRQTQHQSQHHQSQHYSSQASTANQSQSQLCAVCGDNAACQHYGVRTCEGCKGFFKRTVQKGSKYVCLGSKDCPVDKRRRNRCQFCRFQKCLAVGMVKEVVRTDNLKGRRGRLPSKPKSPQENPPSPPISMITALVRAHVDTSPDISNLDFSRYHELSECEAEEFCESDKEQFISLLSSSLEVCRNFGEKIPGFTELDKYDQELLFYSSCLEIFALRFVYQNKPGSAKIVLPNGNVLHRDQVKQLFGDWFINLELFSQRFAQIDIDISAFACLTALSLVTVRHGLKDAFRVESLQMKIIESLRDHVTYNAEAQKKSHYFSSILSKLPDLRSLTMDGLTHLHGIKLQSTVTLPDSISKLFSTILYF